jgi:hypothetical protein
VEGWTPPEELGGTGGIVATGVVMGAVLTAEFGGGVDTLAPIEDEGVDSTGTLPDMDDVGLHSLLTESYAYPSGHVHVGETVVVGVVKPSQLLPLRYHTTKRRATEQLTFW